ncbi:uncharacterized protein JN550_011409 [Neoarthrinium moseri]|uniref:uncharacterized protein n=1 Tax=Neoarthrinium moseri TaxID=1658444 RepID=UPI001FDC5247|nr:uncharacterized protein JN550_011409 [Neoarthrinium moseri]KAI1860684.1 hypothetical protein JN550_011409 [Neoarthrinium moseri]
MDPVSLTLAVLPLLGAAIKTYGALRQKLKIYGHYAREIRRVRKQVERQQQFFHNEGESLKDAVRRLRDRVKITWNKSNFDSSIADLRSFNDDLRRLREQAEELQKPRKQLESTHTRLKPEYGSYGTVRRASRAVHLALAMAWSKPARSCSAASLRHKVKLFIDAKVEDQVHMDMALLCYGHDSSAWNQTQPSVTSFQVRSRVIDWMESGVNTPPRSDDGRQKRQKVRFQDDCTVTRNLMAAESPVPLLTPEDSGLSTNSDDLSGKDICSTLFLNRSCQVSNSPNRCLGFLDTCSEETFRHFFYPDTDPQRLQACHPAPMSQALGYPMEHSLSIVDQLRLARNLVAAVLKFHSTPWLGSCFALADLSFFQIGSELSKSLRTLHFSTDFVYKETLALEPPSMEGIESSCTPGTLLEAFEEAMLQYGIRNLTLWSLGTILLQIGRWSQVESPDDVVAIRKLASQTSTLGPRYQQLTERCLYCDFGYGFDLSKPRLQQAVYENLVCELNAMIDSLKIDDH